MKQSSLITLVVCLASVFGVGTVAAQSRDSMRLTLPYAVTIGSVTLPAGDCTITNLKDNGHETFFLIRSEAGPAADVLMERTEAADSSHAAESAVQLRQVGNKYQIDGIRIDGQNYKVND
jgi:hypothetical protein